MSLRILDANNFPVSGTSFTIDYPANTDSYRTGVTDADGYALRVVLYPSGIHIIFILGFQKQFYLNVGGPNGQTITLNLPFTLPTPTGTPVQPPKFYTCIRVTPSGTGGKVQFNYSDPVPDGWRVQIEAGFIYVVNAIIPAGYSFLGWQWTKGVTVFNPQSPNTSVAFDLAAWDGQCVGHLILSLQPTGVPPPPPSGLYMIQATVTSTRDESPLPGVQVAAYSPNYKSPIQTTDANGRVILTGLPNDTYIVYATGIGFHDASAQATIPPNSSVNITMAPLTADLIPPSTPPTAPPPTNLLPYITVGGIVGLFGLLFIAAKKAKK